MGLSAGGPGSAPGRGPAATRGEERSVSRPAGPAAVGRGPQYLGRGGGGAVPVLQRRFAVPARGGGGERREGRPERPLRRGRGVKTPTAALGGDAAPGLLKATPALAERGAGPGAARPSGWGEGGGGGKRETRLASARRGHAAVERRGCRALAFRRR